MPDPSRPRPERQETPEVVALRRLRIESPELATAVDLQIEISLLVRRLHARLTTPWVPHDPAWFAGRLAEGTPLLRFEDVAFDWVELRVFFRQMADLLARHELIDPGDHVALLALNRDSHPSQEDTQIWFNTRAARTGASHPQGEAFVQTLELCARPFVERAAESVRARTTIEGWVQSYCPLCGSDAEMASVSTDGIRRLHCGACGTAWAFDADTCPACLDHDRRQRLSYTGRDPRYRLVACGACRRYIKTVDMRRMDRPVLLAVDSIATLPLDAAAAQKGLMT